MVRIDTGSTSNYDRISMSPSNALNTRDCFLLTISTCVALCSCEGAIRTDDVHCLNP